MDRVDDERLNEFRNALDIIHKTYRKYREDDFQNIIEPFKYEVMTYLPIEDIINICDTNKKYNKICEDIGLWKFLLERDYGIKNEENPRLRYKTEYLKILKQHISTFKIILLGDSCVGKTTYINRIATGNFNAKCEPTEALDVTKLEYETNRGIFTLEIWDCAGKEELRGLGNAYYMRSDAVIYMFDLTNKNSYDNLNYWKQEYESVVNEYVPALLCGTKIDLDTYNLSYDKLRKKWNMPQFRISSKSNYNLYEPLDHLLRRLTKNKDLKIFDVHKLE